MKIYLPLFSLVLILSANCLAQTASVKGTVKDMAGNPISHATISLENTALGSTTDTRGKFIIKKIIPGAYVIKFSHVGFQSISKAIDTKANETVEVNFETEDEVAILSEVKITSVKTITGMGYLGEVHDRAIFSGKKTEVLILDSLDANTAQNNPRQVLGRVPGANYSETEGSGFPSNGIGFRGLNPTQSIETNTRQNGYNITGDLYGYPESYYLPALEAVERIEVIRGASSLQYGAQFGGVINYIMKKGRASKPFEFTTQQTGGSFGMFNSFNSVGGQVGKFNYYSYLQVQTMQGWRPNSDYKKLTGFARVEYQASEKIKIGIEYSILRNQLHMPGGFSDSLYAVGSRKSYRARNWLRSPWNVVTATLDWKISPHTSVNVKTTFNSSARDLVWRNEDGGPSAIDEIDPITNNYSKRESQHEGFQNNTTEVRLLSNYEMGRLKNTLAAGVRFFSGKMKRQGGGEGTTGSDFDFSLVVPGYEYDLDFTTTNVAPFIENAFRIGDRLTITPGLRYEYIHSTVKGFNPSNDGNGTIFSDYSKDRSIFLAGAGAQLAVTSSTNIYVNYTQAYRPLDYSSLTPFGTIATIDKNMKDSRGANADIGFRGSIKDFLTFDISGFYLQYNDRVGIIEKADANGNLFPFRTNVANSVHKGLEMYVEFNPVKAFTSNKNWSLSFFNSLALINAKYISGEYDGKYVEYAPTSINRFGTNLVIRKFSTTFLISSTAKSYGDAGNSETPSADAVAGIIPAYTVMDWSSTFKFKNFNVKAGINNLADQNYFTKRTDEYPGPGIIPSVGKSFYLGVGAKF